MITRDLGEQRPAMVWVGQRLQFILAGTDGDLGVDVKLPGVREVAGRQLVRDAGDPAQRHAVLHLAAVQRLQSVGVGVPGPICPRPQRCSSYLLLASLVAMSAYSVTSAVFATTLDLNITVGSKTPFTVGF